ncbi:hypothetical protein HC752_18915 [Vibrio sp. S9_S30]|uniref:hypothetical protein n=1 Tax=Vibrio sp. S9_S30 TaxID=2720226 RepID=UPI00167FEA5F|nr:hypothetical protein [Vibrio sp. S9_S30]MBD1559012.1 hypothetical protein [Vibrio sp. S9_S30]
MTQRHLGANHDDEQPHSPVLPYPSTPLETGNIEAEILKHLIFCFVLKRMRKAIFKILLYTKEIRINTAKVTESGFSFRFFDVQISCH